MEFNTYTRKSFEVEALEITEENLEEVAALIGEVKTKEDGVRFIKIGRNRLGPKIWQAYPGYWLTKMGDSLGCYSPKVFEEQFQEADAEVSDSEWATNSYKVLREVAETEAGPILEPKSLTVDPPKTLHVNVFDKGDEY